MKTCSKCKRPRPISEFYRSKERRDGLDPRCKGCMDRNRLTPGKWITERRLHLLRKEKRYLEQTLAHVNRWISRLLCVAAVACGAPERRPDAPVAPQPIESLEVVRYQEPHTDIHLEDILPDPSPPIDLAPIMPPQPLMRAAIEGTTPPTPGFFVQHRRACVDRMGMGPVILCTEKPRAGKTFHVLCWAPGQRAQSLAIATQASKLADGTPLPQPIRNAPDCFVEVPQLSLTPILPGYAKVPLIVPPSALGLEFYMQTVVAAPGENTAGVLTSKLYRVRIGP